MYISALPTCLVSTEIEEDLELELQMAVSYHVGPGTAHDLHAEAVSSIETKLKTQI